MSLDDDACPEEYVKQSTYSPDVVKDDEQLGRLVYADDHVDDETGTLKIGAFKMADLIKPHRKGYSFARLSHTNSEQLREKGAQFEAGGANRRFRGLGIGWAWGVRAIRDPAEQRALCVIDDGKPDDPAHALATRSQLYRDPDLTERQLRAKLKPIREQLISLFSPVTSVDDI